MGVPNYPNYELLWHSGYSVKSGVDLFTFHGLSFHKEVYKMDVFRDRFLDQLNSFTVVLYDGISDSKEKVSWTAYELNLKYLPIFQKIMQKVPSICLNLKASDRCIEEKEISGSFPQSKESVIIGVSTGITGFGVYPSLSLSAFQPGILESDFCPTGNDCTRVFPFAPFFVYRLPDNGRSAYSSELRFLSVFHLTEQQISNIVSIEGKVVPHFTNSPRDKFSRDSDIENSKILQGIHRQERTMVSPNSTGSR
jgi:hypothetical protein